MKTFTMLKAAVSGFSVRAWRITSPVCRTVLGLLVVCPIAKCFRCGDFARWGLEPAMRGLKLATGAGDFDGGNTLVKKFITTRDVGE